MSRGHEDTGFAGGLVVGASRHNGGRGARPFTLKIMGDAALVDAATGQNLLPRSRKARALVVYAALNAGPVKRERLAAILWSDRASEQARASLRQAIVDLRELMLDERPLLIIDREEISLSREMLALDREDFEALAEAGDLDGLEADLARWNGVILADLDGPGPAFDEWLTNVRAATGAALIGAALEAAETRLTDANAALVSMIAARLLAIDPFNERAARLGLRAGAAAGNNAEVHRRYRQFELLLREDLGAAPSEATQRLFHDLARPARVERAPAPSEVALADAAPPASAATKPITRSGRIWLALGLSLIPVVGLTITIFALRLGRVETAIGHMSSAPPLAEPADAMTMTLYQRARDATDSRSRFGEVQATILLQQVVARAPFFSRGWSSLAMAETLDANNPFALQDLKHPASYWLNAARVAANRALAIDPHNGAADAVLALMKPDDFYADKLALINQGIADDPTEGSLFRLRGLTMLDSGYTGRAVADLRRANVLDPNDSRAISGLYSALVLSGQVSEARRLLDDAITRFPLYPHLWREKFVALLAEHRYDDAEAMVSPTVLHPDRNFIGDPAELSLLVRALRSGKTSDIDSAIAPAAVNKADPSQVGRLVWRLALLGRFDQAFRAAAASNANIDLDLVADTPFEAFRRDPRFIVSGIGPLAQWRASGVWPDFCRQPGWPYDCRAVAARSR
jgi:DNA-binding SARP family transcriptional activator